MDKPKTTNRKNKGYPLYLIIKRRVDVIINVYSSQFLKGEQRMNIEQLIQKYKKEKCIKCDRNINCKILVKDNKVYCTEEEE